MVKKLEQSQRETNHKIKMIRQQDRRMADKLSDKLDVVDFASVQDEGDGKSANDIMEELASLACGESKGGTQSVRVPFKRVWTGQG